MINNKRFSLNDIKTVGVVCPSYFVERENDYQRGIEFLKQMGLKIKLGNCVGKRFYNTSGTALERATEINEMFLDKEVDLIVATDGGDTAIEFLDLLDYGMIKNNKKPFCGFSDITHLLLALYTKSDIVSVHGIDILNGFGQVESESKVCNIEKFCELMNRHTFNMDLSNTKVLKHGKGDGVVIGGNINAIEQLRGTEFFPSDEKIVLLWEAIEEEPRKINMMLQSLRLEGLFKRVSGMIVGKLTDCIEREYPDTIPSIETIILNACQGYDFPILFDAPFGHSVYKQPFMYGNNVKIDTSQIENTKNSKL